MPKFGPGTLKIGETASAIDASCLVNSATVEPSKDVGDSRTMLCGTVKPGKTTYTWTLTGNLDVDSDDPAGLFAFCDAHMGEQVPFTYTPENGGTEATGVLVIDPLAFGGEEFGDDLASDFEFDLVGKPTYAFPEDAARQASYAAAFQPVVVHGKIPESPLADAPAAPAKTKVPAPVPA